MGLVAVLGAAWWFSSRAEENVHVAPAAQVKPAAPTSRPPPPPARAEEGPPAGEEVLPAPPAPTVVAAPPPAFAPSPLSTPRPPKHPVDPQQLEQETALLALAKEVVQSDPELSLKRLAQLQQQFPEGALRKDAELVRLEAFLRLGRREEAESLGKKLVGKEPGARKAVERLLEDVRSN